MIREEGLSSFKEVPLRSLSIDEDIRRGLTNAEVESLYSKFYGLMPLSLELSASLAICIEDFVDFAIIIIILIANSILGFIEELKARESLAELTSRMEQRIAVVRDGRPIQLLTRLLVPGDIILLLAGTSVPADVDWLEGDILSIDTSSLTGETSPRRYPSTKYGRRILCGCMVLSGEAYCIVRKTGPHTVIGSSQVEVMHDKTIVRQSLFEARVLQVVKVVMALSFIIVIVIFLFQGFARGEFSSDKVRDLISIVLSILVASTPLALPLVLQVTMALGASTMATDFDAVVTSLPALQDISQMSILCSDKTGTLTTARITISSEHIWCNAGFNRQDVIFYARLASNADKIDDPVDRACIAIFNKFATSGITNTISHYSLVGSTGFNPAYKRVVWTFAHPIYGQVKVAKGLPNKIVNTADGGADDAEDQWVVENGEDLLATVESVTSSLSFRGYRTLGVAIKLGEQPFVFVGILPMLDPPRHDSASTIRKLQTAGVQVKMITGDHYNIAVETAKILGMSTNIVPASELQVDSSERNQRVWDADGFSQVLPNDKRMVVEILKTDFHAVVGMTGDGVNDAPAISIAQCGIAVYNATDAAKNAAAIILTSPGLSAVYKAVIESRKIFRKLKSYVIYRLASTVQIVASLSLIIFIANCEILPLLIILLALFNDLTMLPIAYDIQKASAHPEVVDISHILILVLALGLSQTGFTMLWSFASSKTGFFASDFDVFQCSQVAQTGIWLQMSLSSELLIFSTRAQGFLVYSLLPSPALTCSVLIGCIFISIFASSIPAFGRLPTTDILAIWLYVLCSILISDCVKVVVLKCLDEKFDIMIEEVEKLEDEKLKRRVVGVDEEEMKDRERIGEYTPAELLIEEEHIGKDAEELELKRQAHLEKFNRWINQTAATYPTGGSSRTASNRERSLTGISLKRSLSDDDLLQVEKRRPSLEAMIEIQRRKSSPGYLEFGITPIESARPSSDVLRSRDQLIEGFVVPQASANAGSWGDLRRSHTGAISIRPHTPANKAIKLSEDAKTDIRHRMSSKTSTPTK